MRWELFWVLFWGKVCDRHTNTLCDMSGLLGAAELAEEPRCSCPFPCVVCFLMQLQAAHPRFPGAASASVVELSAGEMLYIPAGGGVLLFHPHRLVGGHFHVC
jgi:hypothetical protein